MEEKYKKYDEEELPKINKLEMLTSIHFWKPILILLAIFSAIVGIIYVIDHYDLGMDLAIGAMCILVIAFFGFIFYIMYSLGKLFYTEHIKTIKANYEELTNQKWDLDEPTPTKRKNNGV